MNAGLQPEAAVAPAAAAGLQPASSMSLARRRGWAAGKSWLECWPPAMSPAALVRNYFQYSCPIYSQSIRRPVALLRLTARRYRDGLGHDEELRARTAGVRLPRQGPHSEPSFRTDPSVCPIMLRHRYRWGTD